MFLALSSLLIARWQMAITLGFHIVFACFGIGLPLLLVIAEWRYATTGELVWRQLAKQWAKAFAMLFAVGAVSGTVLAFELGLLWPGFMGTFGSVIGLPFTLEAFAFFLEAIFTGIYLYSWDRLTPKVHGMTAIPIAVAGFASAWFVVTANAWMNAPQGFEWIGGAAFHPDPIAAMLNPATGPQTAHMIVAAYMASGFGVAAVYATAFLRGLRTRYVRTGMGIALVVGMVATPIQFVVGDWAAKSVAARQPIKLAAMEGQFVTEMGAPLRLGGIPDTVAGATRYAIEVPGMLSWLAYGDRAATVQGLNAFPPELHPPVAVVHYAFQIMVASGTLMLLMTLWSTWHWWRRRTWPTCRLFYLGIILSGIAGFVGIETGWIVTEVGRQPWIVYGIMRTADAVTDAPGIVPLFWTTCAIYAGLSLCTIWALRHVAQPHRGAQETSHAA
ncbi:MAG: cytochrome ubiquinol oxidase subunit I [Deltaproteobacteria bacterium]|nr:cytochrome ubiquinol oxidase subunit I [Deltaproteobacteria bacterium]